jgi:ribosome maturation factor RimP
MINKENIKQLVCSELEGTGIVLVDVQASNSNNIRIVLDSIKGVNIDECVKINKLIENNFDRDEEDYQLEVSSYGIGQPFILPLHYLKNINNEIELYLKNGNYVKGYLKSVELTDDSNQVKFIEISNIKKIKEEGKKKKLEVEEIIKIQNNEIQKAKLIPSF